MAFCFIFSLNKIFLNYRLPMMLFVETSFIENCNLKNEGLDNSFCVKKRKASKNLNLCVVRECVRAYG